MEGMALELLEYVIRREIRPDKRPPVWLKRAVERIEDCCAEPVMIREIAKAAGVHPIHLARSFRRFFNCSPAEYLRQCRIRRASTLLLKSDLPISEVALDSGFSDQTHFTRSFKRITGFTPCTFRKLFAR